MCADLALRQSDGINQIFYLRELQGCESEATSNLLHQTLIFGCACCGVLIEVAVGAAFQVLDDTACDEFHVALGVGEADVFASVDERWAGDAHMNLSGTVGEELADVVA